MTVDAQDTAVFAAINTWLKLTNPTTVQTNTLRSALKTWVALVNPPPPPSGPNVIPETYTLAQGYGADALIGAIVTDIPATSFSIVSGDPNKYFAVWPSAHIRTSEAGPIPPPGTYNLTISASNSNGTGASAVYSIVCQGPVVLPPPTGWPDATNTGFAPTGVTLTPSGAIVVTVAGTTIDSLDITGSVSSGSLDGGIIINANNCTIKRCRIRADGSYGIACQDGVTGTIIQDCTIFSNNNINSTSIRTASATILRCNISATVDGVLITGSNTTVKDSFLHDFYSPATVHTDPITNDGEGNNITIDHNWIKLNSPNNTTAAMTFDAFFNAINGVVIKNNALLGGTFCLRLDASNHGTSNVQLLNNFFGLVNGTSGYDVNTATSVTISGNKDFFSSLNIDNQL